MLGALAAPAPDPIIALMQRLAADPRDGRIDLGVGVYRDAAGRTPVMGAVAAAEARILAAQQTKGYLGLAGDPGFLAAMVDLLLGASSDRVAAVATPGGSGALRQVLALVAQANPDAQVWIGVPSWPNHAAIAEGLGLAVRPHAYLDAGGGVDTAAMLADLEGARAGDVVVLHASCHNPSGADLTGDDWAAVADLCARRGLVPLVDVAYQGFGAGLEEDVAGLRHLAGGLPEVLVAASGSKSFGLYRERVGLALALCAGPAEAGRVGAALAALNRRNFAFPPDHGARVVTTILRDPVLCADWRAELAGIRRRVQANRSALAQALRVATQGAGFDALERQRGMFSLLDLAPDRIEALRERHAIYLVPDGRINIAGLTPATIPTVATAIATVLRG
ncbi:aromatic amino acid aminotransferase [Rhodobaculum claviforme]|uniref:Aromatic amino acid aminotransferase n=1 Tax=Rhodobaculum claviforme TaxID=1549854 RepID=A0A934TNG8_9RHOB|nr:amino acid aminotransferase [Rhodobaculum claviforme]MBK5928512.1 aromatic amino acid aminotransferase [Rhodobaculum claviforme]